MAAAASILHCQRAPDGGWQYLVSGGGDHHVTGKTRLNDKSAASWVGEQHLPESLLAEAAERRATAERLEAERAQHQEDDDY